MPKFSSGSAANLADAHPDLQKLFNEVIKHWDCTVLDGKRTVEEQHAHVRNGVSKTMASKHLEQNDGYAHAVDVTPYPINWQDTQRMYAFGGFVLGIAQQLGIPIRWGGDWNGNRDFKDQSFHDLPHFEIRSP